jgi:hypothetical protein
MIIWVVGSEPVLLRTPSIEYKNSGKIFPKTY